MMQVGEYIKNILIIHGNLRGELLHKLKFIFLTALSILQNLEVYQSWEYVYKLWLHTLES